MKEQVKTQPHELRILITAYDFRPNLGGVASVAFELAHAFRTAGHEVLVLAPIRSDADDSGFEFTVERHSFSRNSWIASVQFVSSLRRASERWKPDAILHTVWFPESLHAAFDKKTPHFQLVHGSEVLESGRTTRKRVRKILAPLKRRVFRSMKKTMAVSQFTRKLVLQECDARGEDVLVVPNGVNPSEFFPEKPSEKLLSRLGCLGKKTLLTLNRLEGYKGNDTILRALPEIVTEIPNIHVIMAGQGPDRPRLEKLARELGVEPIVHFTGALDFSERRLVYNAADLVLLMTRTDWNGPNCEGFGLVLLEAAACGKSAVASLEGGIPDAVIDGETGLLVSPHDSAAVARAVIRFFNEPGLRENLESRALARAREMTWSRMASRITTIMQDARKPST